MCVRVVVVCGVAGDHTQQHKIQQNNNSKHKNTTKTYNITPNNNCDFSCAMSLAGIEPKMFRFRPFSANCYRSGRSLVKTRKKWEIFRTLKVWKFLILIKKSFLIKKTRRARSARRVLMENEVFSQMFVKLKNVSHFHHFSQVPRSHCLDGFLQ